MIASIKIKNDDCSVDLVYCSSRCCDSANPDEEAPTAYSILNMLDLGWTPNPANCDYFYCPECSKK